MQTNAIDFRNPSPFKAVNTYSHLRLGDVHTLAEVLACLDELRRAQPDTRFLCTLDDLSQCCYTSMHACEDDRLLADDEDSNVDFDDPMAVHAFEAARLAHVQTQLDLPALRQDWRDVAGTLVISAEDVGVLVDMNQSPDKVIAHDDVVYVQRVPVPRDDLLIAGLPNGYFSSDWDVFQNHAVIRHLEAAHGYRIFGIGASWLGFVREECPDVAEARALVDDLAALYAPQDAAAAVAAWSELASLLTSRKTLLLGYTENFAE
ncbi:MAG: hypothetical protein EOP81_16715 [Variovorax sp.]|nr:MAG: hypothetical protein EOP81_16715 [Variovorax sp.]